MLFEVENNTESTVWKDVVEYEGLYKVNKNGEILRLGGKVKTKRGHVQSYPDKILKPYKGQVYLSKDGKVSTLRVCNIVASAFLAGYKKGCKVYHIHGDSDSLDNLSLHPIIKSIDSTDDWKDVPSLHGLYQVSKFGEVRSLDHLSTFVHYGKFQQVVKKGTILKQHVGTDGYLHCMVSIEGESKLVAVHRLVAETFIPNSENKPQVNHIDGNKTNNYVENLEWVTASENSQHAKDNGLWNPEICREHSRKHNGIPIRCITDNNRYFESINSAASFYNIDFESVKESILFNRPRKGYIFKYAEED